MEDGVEIVCLRMRVQRLPLQWFRSLGLLVGLFLCRLLPWIRRMALMSVC